MPISENLSRRCWVEAGECNERLGRRDKGTVLSEAAESTYQSHDLSRLITQVPEPISPRTCITPYSPSPPSRPLLDFYSLGHPQAWEGLLKSSLAPSALGSDGERAAWSWQQHLSPRTTEISRKGTTHSIFKLFSETEARREE